MNKKGFTLIELLIVVVIIGILAAIAIPRFGQTRERAFISAMQSDLRQVLTSQELYYQNNSFTYFEGELDNRLGTGIPDDDFAFFPSVGVQIVIAAADNALGYIATADHNNTTVECEVFVGEEGEGTITAGVAPGNIVCTDPS